eukprot:Seg1699.4 transcript_id=Seg1699.4/GoldUCD/mRNA.D3Y31 product="hypothetical protein" protein_id=Seg1699.4/GoldUCD/D3Y31
MAGKERNEDHLEQLFEKLQELKVGKVKRRSTGQQKQIGDSEDVIHNKRQDEELHRTRKIEGKSILRESKLKPPSKITNNKKSPEKQKNIENPTIDENPVFVKSKTMKSQDNSIHRSCSMEFRNTGAVLSQDGFMDNEPDELAEYFEQALCLPKPMSAMAEMMYG